MKCPKCKKRLEIMSDVIFDEKSDGIVRTKLYKQCCGSIQVEQFIKPNKCIDFIPISIEVKSVK